MKRRLFASRLSLALAGAVWLPAGAQAADEGPDAFIKRLSGDVLGAIKGDSAIQGGDIGKVITLVEQRVMPSVNFQRMTAMAIGPRWNHATSEQQKRLEQEFKLLLVRTYAGALAQVSDQTIMVRPLRAAPEDKEVVVRTEVKGRGDPIQLDYRLERADGGWKIYNLNVLGVWLVETYRSQFSQVINSKGIDGLIATLGDRNKSGSKS